MPRRRKSNSGLKPDAAKDVLLRLLAVTKGNDFQLSPQMLEEIEAITIEGADSEWQIQELKRILDRWAIQTLTLITSQPTRLTNAHSLDRHMPRVRNH